MKTRLFILFLLFASIAQAQIPTSGLVGCYLFSGGTNDTSGNANDLTNFGAVPAADRFGTPASAYQFDGWSSYMLSNIPTLPVGNSPRTVSAFFKTPTPQVTDQYVLGWGTQNMDQEWYLDINNGNLRLVVWNDDVILTPVAADTWVQFAATYTDSTVTVYVNGRSAGISTHILNTVSQGYLSVGATMVNDSLFTGFFKGEIDDICIYDRALSASEIWAVYHAAPGASTFAGGAPAPMYDTTSGALGYDSLTGTQAYSPSNPPPSADAAYPSPPAIADAEYDQADPQGFQAALNPYGEWVNANLGYAWRPLGTGMGWRPYLYGRWEWTDYGWYWVSSEPFGWATYHYGRWYIDSFYGWVWLPGATWGPSWVEWRSNDNYVGWAPLTPASAYTSNGMIVENNGWYSPAPYWTFVGYGSFGAVAIGDHAEPVGHYQQIMPNTHRSVVITSRGGRVVNSGIDVRVVSRHMGTHVPRAAVIEGTQGGGEKMVRGGGSQRVQVYRPQITRLAMRPKIAPAGQDQSGSAPTDQQGGGSVGRDMNGNPIGGGGGGSAPAPTSGSQSAPFNTGGGATPSAPGFTTGTHLSGPAPAPAPVKPTPTGTPAPAPASPNQGSGSGGREVTPPSVKSPTPVVSDPAPAPTPVKQHLHKHRKAAQSTPAPAPAPAPVVIKPAPAPPPPPKKQDAPVVIKPDPTHH
jgi:hypothetical protein